MIFAMGGVDQWWAEGEHLQLVLSGVERLIFVRRSGTGPSMTLLHGYPSSSHDWHKVSPSLAERNAILMPDFLGFGASDKPDNHVYSIHEQADLVEAVWDAYGIEATTIVAHDYAVSVTQELLARHSEGALKVGLDAVHLLNGGIYPAPHRPETIQQALHDPEQGPKIGPLLNEELFATALAPTFAPDFDSGADAADIWTATIRNGGQLIAHLLIRYITDRETHEARWVGALEMSEVPISFIWGMLDPISGSHVAERIRSRLPAAPLVELEAVGHWPALEAPDQVAAAIVM